MGRTCRVCGLAFRSRRFDAITCSSTCRQRLRRGQALAYLAGLSKAMQTAERKKHAALDGEIAERRGRTRKKQRAEPEEVDVSLDGHKISPEVAAFLLGAGSISDLVDMIASYDGPIDADAEAAIELACSKLGQLKEQLRQRQAGSEPGG